jgi:hypothetical protein
VVLDILAVEEAQVGSLYSQLTGVLAGFAFAGLVLVITQRLERSSSPHSVDRSFERGAVLLFSSFLGLTLTSLGYGVIGGETGNSQRAAIEHVVSGAGFAAATLVLLLAILELIRPLVPTAEPFVRSVTGTWAPLVAVVYVTAGALDAAGRTEGVAQRDVYILAAILVAVNGIAIILSRGLSAEIRQVRAYSRVAVIGIAPPFLASTSVALLSSASAGASTAFWPVWCSLVLVGVIASGMTLFCATSR